MSILTVAEKAFYKTLIHDKNYLQVRSRRDLPQSDKDKNKSHIFNDQRLNGFTLTLLEIVIISIKQEIIGI